MMIHEEVIQKLDKLLVDQSESSKKIAYQLLRNEMIKRLTEFDDPEFTYETYPFCGTYVVTKEVN